MTYNGVISVVDAHGFCEALLEGIPVALGLHEQILKFPLFVVGVIGPFGKSEVVHCVPEIIQFQVINAVVIALVEMDVFRFANVVELLVVAGGKHFDAISHEMTVKLHEEPAKGQIMGRDMSTQVFVIAVSK